MEDKTEPATIKDPTLSTAVCIVAMAMAWKIWDARSDLKTG